MKIPKLSLEKSLNTLFVKIVPVQLPEKSKKNLVEWLPWIMLIVGVLGLVAAYSLWTLGHTTNDLIDYINEINHAAGVRATTPEIDLAYWLALGVLVIFSVIDIVAFVGLKARKKIQGWNLILYAALLNFSYAVILLFVNGRGVRDFTLNVISSLVIFYVLFQVRSHYA